VAVELDHATEQNQACRQTTSVLLLVGKWEWAGLACARLSSVEVASRSDQYALDSQHAAERFEVSVIVQNARSRAPLRRRR
jgi:hypothetical protein